ncbi:MAG TPA: PQQ-binding-like beta-propeller repeat protein, partial [Sphingomicrobium sp.]|nr:PQQ-binding-like beta-propeller repeat protein [Sphingomicrobium sp.]
VESPRSLTGIRFRFQADGPVRGGFGLVSGRLLFGTETGTIYALDARDGHVAWRRAVGSPVLSTPAISGSRGYFTTWDNNLHALDLATGREVWRRNLGQTLGAGDYWEYYVSSPIAAAGRLYVGSASGRLFALDSASGRVAWSADAGGRVRSTPVIAANAVVVGTNAGHVVAFDRSSGRKLWRFATEGAAHDFSFKDNDTRSVVTAPIVTGGLVIAGARDGNVYGIDLQTGAERWRETHDGGSWILGLADDGKTFYSGSGSALIVQAADIATGKEVWRTATGNALFGGLAKAGSVLVSNGSNGNLFGFDSATGAQLWRFRLADMALASPLVTTGAVFTGSDDGSVYALETATAAAPAFDRLVYSFTNQPEAGFFWLKPDRIETIRGGLASAGYAKIGNAELIEALAAPISGGRRKIIVLADTRLPPEADPAVLRRFLDGGGVLVLVAPDPVVYGFDSSGAPATIDTDKEKAAFGLDGTDRQLDYGYNVSAFAPSARTFGLTGSFVSIGWQKPSQVSLLLASDRSGMATAWAKRFDHGGLLIDLPLPRYGSLDTARLANAVDLLAAREAFAGK